MTEITEAIHGKKSARGNCGDPIRRYLCSCFPIGPRKTANRRTRESGDSACGYSWSTIGRANYIQFQEKVQAFAAAVENFRSKGGAGVDLARFEQSLKLYKDSVDLWGDELDHPVLYESDRHLFVPTQLQRIARGQGLDLTKPRVPYKYYADQLLQQLWAKADPAARGATGRGTTK